MPFCTAFGAKILSFLLDGFFSGYNTKASLASTFHKSYAFHGFSPLYVQLFYNKHMNNYSILA
jgi:hypothetical protein